MQTFLAFPLFEKAAKILDRQRLGKQRVECLQILQCLTEERVGWKNHPCVKMWAGHEKSLAVYGLYICNEWIKRGYKDTCFGKIQKFIPNYVFREFNFIEYFKKIESPSWLGDNKFHSTHRAALLYKNFDYYKQFGWTEKPELNYIWPV